MIRNNKETCIDWVHRASKVGSSTVASVVEMIAMIGRLYFCQAG
jgi:hypothetical protein